MSSAVVVVLGLVVLAFSVWQRAGRSRNARAWLASPGRRAVTNNLLVYPAVGCVLVAVGVIPLVEAAPQWLQLVLVLPLALLLFGGLVVAFTWLVIHPPFPRWVVPGWAREQVRRRRKAGTT